MKKLSLLFLISLTIFSCKKDEKKSGETTTEINNSTNNEEEENEEENDILNWDGSYVGVLPCEDCDGQNTEVILKINHTFEKSTSFLNSKKPEIIEKGNFIWIEEGCTIALNDKNKTRLRVFKNTLRVLNKKGEEFTKDSEKYELKKNICEDKDFEEFIYFGNDDKKYDVTFGQSCDGYFTQIKCGELDLLLFRETASEISTTYGNEKGVKLIDERLKATLYLKDNDIVLIPEKNE